MISGFKTLCLDFMIEISQFSQVIANCHGCFFSYIKDSNQIFEFTKNVMTILVPINAKNNLHNN